MNKHSKSVTHNNIMHVVGVLWQGRGLDSKAIELMQPGEAFRVLDAVRRYSRPRTAFVHVLRLISSSTRGNGGKRNEYNE